MTNNGVGKLGNSANVIYDSSSETPTEKRRIGTSATEIEFLDDIPPPIGRVTKGSENNVSERARAFETQTSSSSAQRQQTTSQNGYQQLSLNREQVRPNVPYQGANDQQLNSAVDKLLEKYAPDATPQNTTNTSTSRRPTFQDNVISSREEPPVSAYQTNPPASSNNYSTIIRPRTGQTSQTQTQMNSNTANNNQSATRQRPATAYDSFQHAVPSQQQQQQQSIPIKTKNGNVSQVVPGKLYTLDDDPLHLLYDRQNSAPSNHKAASRPQQQQSSNTTFQPSNNFQTSQEFLTATFANTSQRFPSQPLPVNRETGSNGAQPFDLADLIKRVQQDYLREIQPFVSSVKFVEKDREYGQSLADIGFTTPVTVRKGFTRQADDILRGSSGRQGNQRKPVNKHDRDDYSDDDVNQRPQTNRRQPLEKFDSKQSFTSVTSASTNGSDSDEVLVHDQATSPLAKSSQPIKPIQAQNPSITVSKPSASNVSDEEDDMTTTASTHPVVTKRAQRISETSSGSSIHSDDEEHSATYNEHDAPQTSRTKPSESVNAVVTNTPIIKPVDEATRERVAAGNQGPQRSEDIHPIAPTRPSQPNQVQARKTESEESGAQYSGSEGVSESDAEDISTPPIDQPPSRSNIPGVPPGRSPNMAQTSARVTSTSAPANQPPSRSNVQSTTPSAPPGRSSNVAETSARVTSTAQNPPSTTQRATTDNNARQVAGTAPNIPFVPVNERKPTDNRSAAASAPNQRNPTDNRSAQAAAPNPPPPTAGAAQTDADPKVRGKQSTKEGTPTFGDKIKNIFRRK